MAETVQGLQGHFNQTAVRPSPPEVTGYLRAAAIGDFAGVQAFLNTYPGRIDATDSESVAFQRGNSTGLSALQLAALNNRADMVVFLLDRGANIEIANTSGWTSLIHAAACGHKATVAVLLECGASMTVKNSGGWNAERAAKENGHHPDSKEVRNMIKDHTKKQKELVAKAKAAAMSA